MNRIDNLIKFITEYTGNDEPIEVLANEIRIHNDINPMALLLAAKILTDIADKVKSIVKQRAVDFAYNRKITEISNYKIQIRNGAPKYDFSQINTWNELQENMLNLKNYIKTIENALKNAHDTIIDFIDPETGEVIKHKLITINGYSDDTIAFIRK